MKWKHRSRRDNIVLQKEVADNVKDTDDVNDGLMPEKTEEPDVKTESDKGQQTGSKMNLGMHRVRQHL